MHVVLDGEPDMNMKSERWPVPKASFSASSASSASWGWFCRPEVFQLRIQARQMSQVVSMEGILGVL